MPTETLKSYSFRRHLFLLVASFFVVLVTFQLWFFSYIQTQIKTEIQQRSATLSNVAVQVVSRKLFVTEESHNRRNTVSSIDENPQDVVRITVTDTPEKAVDIGGGFIFITGKDTKILRIDYGRSSRKSNPQQTKRFEHASRLEFSTIGDAFQFALTEPETNIISRHIVQFDKSSVIDRYFTWLMLMTLLLMLGGIGYALWLASTISRPLESLSEGFKALEKGRYGTQVWVQGTHDMQHTMQQFNNMSSNLQALKQMEEKVSQQQQLLELNEVTRGMAHSLRNPLNTIGLTIEQTMDADLSGSEKRQLVQQVRDKIIRLDRTIKTMLSVNVQDVDRTQSVDLVAVIQDIIMELSFSFEGKIHYEPQSSILLQGAQVEIRAILHTVLTNAVEASIAKREQNVTDVHIAVQQQVAEIRVTVSDQGKGLSPSIKSELFKPHVTDKPEGAGMGLFIANRICQSYYQGEISIDDNQPSGCIVTVIFGTGK
jgi:signal transduction histidine kinase